MPPIGKGLPRRSSLSRCYPSAVARLKRREIIKQKEKPWYDGGPGTPALPGEPCRTPPHPSWTEPEKWVWERVCAGQEANFNIAHGKKLEPADEDAWTAAERGRRKLSPVFLRTILTRAPWRDAITEDGVCISGAVFEHEINLNNATIYNQLWLDECLLEEGFIGTALAAKSSLSLDGSNVKKNLILHKAKIHSSLHLRKGIFDDIEVANLYVKGQVALAASVVNGILNMNGCRVEASVFLNDNALFYGRVELGTAKISGQLCLNNAEYRDVLSLGRVVVEGDLLMDQAKFIGRDVLLGGAKIGGIVAMNDSIFNAKLKMDYMNVAESQFLSGVSFNDTVSMASGFVGGALFFTGAKGKKPINIANSKIIGNLLINRGEYEEKVSIFSVKIGGKLIIDNSMFMDNLNMDRITVGSALSACAAIFRKNFNLANCEVADMLVLWDSAFNMLDLTNSHIEGGISLAWSKNDKIIWHSGGYICLRNAKVGVVADKANSWPKRIDLEGCVYNQFGGYKDEPSHEAAQRSASWFAGWLSRHQPYSPQPYEQCAKVLREAGQPDKANAVLFAGKERERASLRKPGRWPGWRWLGQSFLRATIGYGLGYRYCWSLIWAIALIYVGAVVFASSDANWPKTVWRCFGYSLDMVLPVVQLAKEHYDKVDITGWQRYYFYFHQLSGFVLASVVLAGLAGVIRK